MAVKKDAPLQDIEIDAAVQAYLARETQAEVNARRKKEMKLTRAQRRKREKDAARTKATYDLPETIKERIEVIATEFGIPKSQLAAFFLDHAIREYDIGRIDLRPYLRPSRVPRFESFLILPGDANDDGWSILGWGRKTADSSG